MNIDDLLVIDTETTGPDPFVHDLISVALVPMDRSISGLEVYVDFPADASWSDFARNNFRKLESPWRSKAVSPSVAVEIIQNYIDDFSLNREIYLAGHNVGFDRAFFQKLAFKAGRSGFRSVSHRNYDTHSVIMHGVLLGKYPESVVQSSGAFEYFNIDVARKDRHTAMGDALATRDLIAHLLMTTGFKSELQYATR